MVTEGQLLWEPSAEFARASNIARYMDWLDERRYVSVKDYHELWKWSVSKIEAFWASIWEYFEVESDLPYGRVMDRPGMPGTQWFPGARLNYAEHLLRYARTAPDDEVVFHHASEIRPLARMTWKELASQVRVLGGWLRDLGIKPGDRVVSYMPNVPETAVAMMATVAIGAVWSSAAPEFGAKTVIERFAQIEPKLIFLVDGYRFGGKDFDRREQAGEVIAGLPTLTHAVWLPYLDEASLPPEADVRMLRWRAMVSGPDFADEYFLFERVEHDHPLWILFSSGTTGLPKAIVHSHAGMLLEHLKAVHFHLNLKPGSTLLFYSTTGWMMWNLLLAALLAGSSAVLFDGNPMHPDGGRLWQLVENSGTTLFGVSPTFVQLMEKEGLRPGEKFDLTRLEGMIVAGAPATPETFKWCYDHVKKDLWVTSQSGGTELCSGFVGGAPTLPVYAGEIQTRNLGMDVHSWNETGEEVVDEVAELVVTSPFPSMPIRFWNDPGGRRYRESYFDTFPGVWRHGDFLRINARGGCYISGRSDSTLNRFGVRIGTAEVYRIVESVPEVADSLIVCCELPAGGVFMPLFVKLAEGAELTDELRARLSLRLRMDGSPRHVPDKIYAVPDIPYTLTGKKMEIPARKILLGQHLETVASRDAMANPRAIDYFVDFAKGSMGCTKRSQS